MERTLRERLFETTVRYDTKLAEKLLKRKQLVVSSGGLIFLDMMGFFSLLQDSNLLPDFETLVVVSAGSIVGTILTSGINIKELSVKLYMNFSKIKFTNISNPFKIYSLIVNGYLEETSKVKDDINDFIIETCFANKFITFREHFEITKKKLIIVCSNIVTEDVFYASIDTIPDLPIREALKASSTVPYIWKPVPMKLRSGEIHYFIDGAISNSFPIDIFLDECSRFSYYKMTGVELPKIDKNNFFGLKVNDIGSGYDPVFNSSVPNPPTESEINLFRLIPIIAKANTYGQTTTLTKEWLNQSTEISYLVEKPLTRTIEIDGIVDGFNNGVLEAIRMLDNFRKTDGESLRS